VTPTALSFSGLLAEAMCEPEELFMMEKLLQSAMGWALPAHTPTHTENK
jgi:hypothetical protein